MSGRTYVGNTAVDSKMERKIIHCQFVLNPQKSWNVPTVVFVWSAIVLCDQRTACIVATHHFVLKCLKKKDSPWLFPVGGGSADWFLADFSLFPIPSAPPYPTTSQSPHFSLHPIFLCERRTYLTLFRGVAEIEPASEIIGPTIDFCRTVSALQD